MLYQIGLSACWTIKSSACSCKRLAAARVWNSMPWSAADPHPCFKAGRRSVFFPSSGGLKISEKCWVNLSNERVKGYCWIETTTRKWSLLKNTIGDWQKIQKWLMKISFMTVASNMLHMLQMSQKDWAQWEKNTSLHLFNSYAYISSMWLKWVNTVCFCTSNMVILSHLSWGLNSHTFLLYYFI